MYIGIDIGGTKTLVAALTNDGIISEAVKFPTPKDYPEWKRELETTVRSLKHQEFKGGALAMPGEVDRKKGVGVMFGNLPWRNIALVHDVEKITGCKIIAENDAKLAGLSEALLLKDKYSRVLYVTISTGIGIGLTVDGQIDTGIGDGGGRTMLFAHKGKMVPWETFGAGSAIVKKYGKFASEITDVATWSEIVKTFAPGFIELIAILEPEAIVVGGGAGHYLRRFHRPLVEELKQYETPMFRVPPILPAKRPDEAVVYGCYDYARQHFA